MYRNLVRQFVYFGLYNFLVSALPVKAAELVHGRQPYQIVNFSDLQNSGFGVYQQYFGARSIYEGVPIVVLGQFLKCNHGKSGYEFRFNNYLSDARGGFFGSVSYRLVGTVNWDKCSGVNNVAFVYGKVRRNETESRFDFKQIEPTANFLYIDHIEFIGENVGMIQNLFSTIPDVIEIIGMLRK